MAGPLGFFKGLEARVLYSMPATAICWSTYEFFKYILSRRSHEEYRSSVSGHRPATARPTKTIDLPIKSDDTTKANIAGGYVIPKRNIIREEKATLALQASSVESAAVGTTTTLLPPPQLPSISGTGVYNALSFNTVHTDGMYDRKSSRGCNT